MNFDEGLPPAHKIESLKKALIWLLQYDPEVGINIRRAIKSKRAVKQVMALTADEICDRIRANCRPVQHKGRMNAYFCREIYSALEEYSQFDVKDMLEYYEILIKSTCKTHPIDKTKQRVFILRLDV